MLITATLTITPPLLLGFFFLFCLFMCSSSIRLITTRCTELRASRSIIIIMHDKSTLLPDKVLLRTPLFPTPLE